MIPQANKRPIIMSVYGYTGVITSRQAEEVLVSELRRHGRLLVPRRHLGRDRHGDGIATEGMVVYDPLSVTTTSLRTGPGQGAAHSRHCRHGCTPVQSWTRNGLRLSYRSIVCRPHPLILPTPDNATLLKEGRMEPQHRHKRQESRTLPPFSPPQQRLMWRNEMLASRPPPRAVAVLRLHTPLHGTVQPPHVLSRPWMAYHDRIC
jgi:hypothetical protein